MNSQNLKFEYFIGKNKDKQGQLFLLIESFYVDQFVNEYSNIVLVLKFYTIKMKCYGAEGKIRGIVK